jgi:hypothetical protein
VDVVLRLLLGTAVFIRFGERVCDILSACDSRAVAPLLQIAPASGAAIATKLVGARNTVACPRDEAHAAARRCRQFPVVGRRSNVPKDLRFSIGPDIKDALPGFSCGSVLESLGG